MPNHSHPQFGKVKTIVLPFGSYYPIYPGTDVTAFEEYCGIRIKDVFDITLLDGEIIVKVRNTLILIEGRFGNLIPAKIETFSSYIEGEREAGTKIIDTGEQETLQIVFVIPKNKEFKLENVEIYIAEV